MNYYGSHLVIHDVPFLLPDTETKRQLYVDEHVEGLIKVMTTGDGGLLGSICPEKAKYWRGSPKVGE